MPKVKPAVLEWARKTAGFSLDDAAKAIGLDDARGVSGADRLARMETAETEISRQLLGRMAERYRRPLIAFYLDAPPPVGERGEDFRQASRGTLPDFNPNLDALIRNVRARHDVVKFLLEDDESELLDFVASAKISDGVAAVANDIIKVTGFDLVEFRSASDVSKAFEYLRERLERTGLFVLLLGDLGSYHSKIQSRAFRGYAIADRIAPFIVINDNDARAAWSFTALHEAVHIWLGQTGVSGSSHAAAIERFCNDVAAAILLPSTEADLINSADLQSLAGSIAAIASFAFERNVSRAMVAYLLLRRRKITATRYEELDKHFYGEWQKATEKEPVKEERGGPHRYVVLRHRLGPALIRLARQYLDAGSLSPTKASSLLGVKPSAVRTFLHPESAR